MLYFDRLVPALAHLDDAQAGILLRALVEYAQAGTIPTLDGLTGFAFDMLRPGIDQDGEAYMRKWAHGNYMTYARKCKETGQSPVSEDEYRKQLLESSSNYQLPKPTPKPKPTATASPKSKTKQNTPAAPDRASDFSTFWTAYPRKVGKAAAEKAFLKVEAPLQTLLDAVEAQKRSPQWTRDGGQFIPYPATWLNQRRWEDEIAEATPPVELPGIVHA